MFFYNDWALRILRGNWTEHTAFYGLPLYAYLLAGIYKICGYSPFVPGLLQAGCEGGTAVLLYKLGSLVFLGSDKLSEAHEMREEKPSVYWRRLAGPFFYLRRLLRYPHADGVAGLRLLVCCLANRQTRAGPATLAAAAPRRVNWLHCDGNRNDLISCPPLARGPFPPLGRSSLLSKHRGDHGPGRRLPRRVAGLDSQLLCRARLCLSLRAQRSQFLDREQPGRHRLPEVSSRFTRWSGSYVEGFDRIRGKGGRTTAQALRSFQLLVAESARLDPPAPDGFPKIARDEIQKLLERL